MTIILYLPSEISRFNLHTICLNRLGKAGSLRSPSQVKTVIARSSSTDGPSMPVQIAKCIKMLIQLKIFYLYKNLNVAF